MKEINIETIYDLPVHDSDFLGMKISQNDSGETELSLTIAFCKGEFEDLPEHSGVISPEGHMAFVFNNCEWININTFCNRTQRDSIDYIEFKKDTPELKQYNPQKGNKHIMVVFTSGSKIECISKSIELASSFIR
ncbi:MAG: hypothetical protein KKD73_12355 [Proteobacteria bacterium]|nr:hypothetical protein [Pseudomonadota bacterium]MBU1640972.1 hypothetical protein [Pseudomonadota bacterium]